MQTKMTKEEVINFAVHVDRVNGHKGAKFNYALCVNQEEANKIKRAVEKINKPADDFMKYEKARLDLCSEMAEKGDDNKPKTRVVPVPGGGMRSEFVGLDDNPEFKQRMEELLKKHDAAIEARKAQTAEVEELLQEEAEIDLHMVRFEDVPETLTREHMNPLMPMILPPEEEKK